MPYIITTRPDYRTRTAVATLFDAHVKGDELIESYGGSIDEWPDLPESGGTIGPLPDGTVVEVRQVNEVDCVCGVTIGAEDLPTCPVCERDAFDARA